jgi:8-oxo-dGTP pyrophosphatase MutT (NUDIX family)
MQKKFAPREIFEQLLEWSVIPTFDILFEYGDQGVIFLKRTITPYENVWALPGLRMYKGEDIEETLQRIAKEELGLNIDGTQGIYLGQYTAKFKTEHDRQDLSTGYLFRLSGSEKLEYNKQHFSNISISNKCPEPIGAMYQYYFELYKQNS